MSSPWYYRAEAKGIQAWILASDRLKELKGGSEIIEQDLPAAAARLATRCSGAVVLAAAGGVEVRFADVEGLRRFASVWPMTVEQLAPGLPMVQAWVEDTRDPNGVFAALTQRLAAARNHAWPSLPEAGPLAARSARTGLPSVSRADDAQDAAVRVKVRRAESVEERSYEGGSGRPLRMTDDNSELGERYLAVIHADGNGVGKLLTEAAGTRTGEWKKDFADALANATRGAAEDAFERLARTQVDSTDGVLRARRIVCGGDDLTALVDAEYAIPFTSYFLQEFAERTRRAAAIDGPKGLTACAGVAIVKVGFPFHAASQLAEVLCKWAKASLRAEGGLAFHRVTTASTASSWEGLAPELSARDGDLLTAGPYNIDRLRHLDELALALETWPRGAAREWLSVVRADPSRADALWTRSREVADPSALRRLDLALRALEHDPMTGWQGAEGSRRTAIGDALLWRTLQPRLLAGSRLWGMG